VVQDLIEAGRLQCVQTTLPKMVRQCHWVVRREKEHTPALLRFIKQISRRSGTSHRT